MDDVFSMEKRTYEARGVDVDIELAIADMTQTQSNGQSEAALMEYPRMSYQT